MFLKLCVERVPDRLSFCWSTNISDSGSLEEHFTDDEKELHVQEDDEQITRTGEKNTLVF